MFLKEMRLRNFKSYKQERITHFEKGVNLILGKNGHGKSNLLHAIQFVVTNKYQGKIKQERESLCYKGLSNEEQEIEVDLIFDNTGRGLPVKNPFIYSNVFQIDKDQVSIRRVWTVDGKDDLYLNGKGLTRNDADNLFECCGLPRQSAYNIVQQGMIHQMIQMNEEKLFNMLKDITGSKQYETKKQEAEQSFEDVLKQREIIQTKLEEIDLKINQLQEQKDRFTKFEKKDIKAKCIQLAIYKRSLLGVQKKLDKILANYEENVQAMTKLRSEEINIMQQKEQIAQEIQSKKQEDQNKQSVIDELKKEISSYEVELKTIKMKEMLKQEPSTQTKDKTMKRHEQLQKQLKKVQKLKANFKKRVNADNKQQIKLSEELRSLQAEYDFLMLKQGEPGKKTKSNMSIHIEILKCKLQKAYDQQGYFQQVESESSLNIKSIQQFIKQEEKTFSKMNSDHKKTSQEIVKLKSSQLQVGSKIKKVVFEIMTKKAQKEENVSILQSYQRRLNTILKNNLFNTILNVSKVVKEENIPGVNGLLIDLIEIPEKLRMCCDIGLRNKLFSFIVEDDQVASTLLKINKEQQGSSFSIFPLNWQERQPKLKYPKDKNVIVMRHQIKPHQGVNFQNLDLLLDKLFGRLLFVKDFDMALKYAAQYKMDCVTGNGEIVYSGGFLTKMGFYDISRERISNYMRWKDKFIEQNTFGSLSEELLASKDKLANEELKINQQLQKLIQKKNSGVIRLRQYYQELAEQKEELQKTRNTFSLSVASLEETRRQIKAFTNEIKVFDNDEV